MMPNDAALPIPSPAAIFQRLDEGAVLFSTSEEVYFGVNAVGARIWELLPPVCETFGALCEHLGAGYPDVTPAQLRADAATFLEQLVASGLAIPADDARHARTLRQGAA